MPDRATDAQRWQIADLFAKFGYTDMDQIRADAARILKREDLTDLRELTAEESDALIGELRAALAVKRVSDG